MTFEIGGGISFGGGISIEPTIVTTSSGQNVTGGSSATGFFFAVLNRSEPGWDYFAANGNNGSWTVTGNFGSGTVTIPVISVTDNADSVFPVVDQGLFQSGAFYTFQGY